MFQITKTLPLPASAVERAVANFVMESTKHEQFTSPINNQGLYNQTIENIGSIIVTKPEGRYFWLDHNGKEVLAYAMTHVSKDVDNQPCYYMTQAWVHPILRGTHQVKLMYECLRQHAINLMCKHIIVVSSRGTKGYCRFLGKNWKPYVTLLKEDI